MTFGSSGTGTGMDNSIPEVQEREGNGINPFPNFGKRKGMKKTLSKFWNGKGVNNSIPKIGNQRLSFPGIPGNGNGNEKNY